MGKRCKTEGRQKAERETVGGEEMGFPRKTEDKRLTRRGKGGILKRNMKEMEIAAVEYAYRYSYYDAGNGMFQRG